MRLRLARYGAGADRLRHGRGAALLRSIPTLAVVVEEDLLANETLFFNAGRLDRSMELDTKDWLAVARPRIAKIAAKV